jgi:hypothetical protein
MSTRKIDIIAGVETAAFPTATDPSGDSDVMTKGYSDKTYTSGVATVAALKAIAAASRTDAMSIFVKSLNAYFYFSSGSSATGDDISVITPTAGSGRWLRASGTGTASHVQTFDASGIPSSAAQLPIAQGGTGQATASAAFNALSPNTTLGDLTYGSGTNTSTRLAGNTSATKKFLSQTGNGTISAIPAWSQPAFTDITGTVAAAQLPNPSSSTLGGVQSAAAVSHQWINSISTSGVPALSQPAFTDISGTVAASQLPNPSSSTLGGIQSAAAVSNQWINSISTSGVPSLSQPAFSNLSGTASLTTQVSGTLPTGNGGTGVTSVTTAPTASAFAGWDANSNLSANNHIEGYATTATAAGTTTLTISSPYQQYFTGITTQTVKLPVVSTLVSGMQYTITNLSTGVVTVQSSGANTLQAMATNTCLVCTVISTSGTGTASWSWAYQAIQNSLSGGGTVSSVDMSVPSFLSVSGNPIATSGTLAVTYSGTALPVANGGTGVTNAFAIGKSYNPTITSNRAGWSTTRSTAVVYQTTDGTWRMKFNISGTYTSTTTTTVTLTFQSTTVFKNVANFFQACSYLGNGTVNYAAQVYANPNTANVIATFPSITESGCSISGDVELNAQPSWAT